MLSPCSILTLLRKRERKQTQSHSLWSTHWSFNPWGIIGSCFLLERIAAALTQGLIVQSQACVLLLGFAEQGSVAGMPMGDPLIPSHGTGSLPLGTCLHGVSQASQAGNQRWELPLSKDWNLGWSPKLWPLLVCCSCPWWRQEAPVPSPCLALLGVMAGRYQLGFCSGSLSVSWKYAWKYACKSWPVASLLLLVDCLVPACCTCLYRIEFSWKLCWKHCFKATVKCSAHVFVCMHLYTSTCSFLARPCFPRAAFALKFARFFRCCMCVTSDFRGKWQELESLCEPLLCYCRALIQKLNSDCIHLAHTHWPWWQQVVKEHGLAPHFAALGRWRLGFTCQ